MTPPASANSKTPLARSVALLVLVAFAGLTVAGLVLAAGGWLGQLPYATAAAAAALLGALLALTPMRFVGGAPARVGSAALMAMVIRPLVTGLAVAGGVVLLNLPLRPLLLWAAGFYMILLFVEVMLISRQLGTGAQTGPGSPPARPELLLIASLLATTS